MRGDPHLSFWIPISFAKNKAETFLRSPETPLPGPSIRAQACASTMVTLHWFLHDAPWRIQHGGKVFESNRVNSGTFDLLFTNMALVAGMGLGVLLLLIFWTIGIVGCVALSRAEGPLK